MGLFSAGPIQKAEKIARQIQTARAWIYSATARLNNACPAETAKFHARMTLSALTDVPMMAICNAFLAEPAGFAILMRTDVHKRNILAMKTGSACPMTAEALPAILQTVMKIAL